MRLRSTRLLVVPILACALALVAGCSTTSGGKAKKRVVLATDYDDTRYGAEASKEVAAQMGLLNDPALDAYVSQLGHLLLRGVPRRGFDFQFKIVDQFEPNAFALPGGYIFVSRGLLALAENEDELACVIGHEITHALARHGAAQQALASRGNPLSMPWVRAATMAGYSRDMEREADKGGQMLAAAAGFDPMGMSTFLRRLGDMERLMVGYARAPTFYDTHPGSTERAATSAVRAREIRWQRDPHQGDTTVSYLKRIDGLALGQRPQEGIFRDSRFLQPDLDFQLNFPEGWKTANSHQVVGAIAPSGDAVVFLTVDLPAGEPEEVAEKFLAKAKEEGHHIRVDKMEKVVIAGIDAWRMQASESTGAFTVVSVTTFLPRGDATWRITGMALANKANVYMSRFLNTARSYRPLTKKELASITAARLRLAQAQPGETLDEIGRRTGSAWPPNRAAVYNGVFADHQYQGGELVKVAIVEPYTPKPPASK